MPVSEISRLGLTELLDSHRAPRSRRPRRNGRLGWKIWLQRDASEICFTSDTPGVLSRSATGLSPMVALAALTALARALTVALAALVVIILTGTRISTVAVIQAKRALVSVALGARV